MTGRGPVARAHAAMAACLRPGDWAVDATAGNGHDALFLAQTVGPQGWVVAFDVQPAAATATRRRLAEAGVAEWVDVEVRGHEHLTAGLPPTAWGRVRGVMFNLGYLPAGDKSLITRPDTTLAALQGAAAVLAPGGRLTVVAYPGHAGGGEETAAVAQWAQDALPGGFRCRGWDEPDPAGKAPRLFVLERVEAG